MRRWIISATLVTSCACGKAEYPGPLLPPPETSAALTAVATCEDLDARIKRHLVQQMEREVEASFEAAFDVDCPSFWSRLFPTTAYDEDNVFADGGVPSSAETYTTTNNQVAGVDEADIIKNDGSTIYVLSGNELTIVRAWPVADATVIGRVTLEGSLKKLLVSGGRAVVYAAVDERCQYYGDTNDAATLIHVVDVSDLTAPRLERTIRASGSLVSARSVGPAIHSVLTQVLPHVWYPHYGSGVSACDDSSDEMRAAYLELIARNRDAIAALPIRARFPTVTNHDVQPDGSIADSADRLANCAGFYDPDFSDARRLTSVLSFPVDDDTQLSTATIVGGSSIVYATADTLYTATSGVGTWGTVWWDALTTSLHAFSLDAAGGAPTYRASGSVQGTIINQFALDAHLGHLRVATTFFSNDRYNSLYVLEERGSELAVAGKVESFGPNEDIRSVRFDGDRGYVVTFEKTDPLFAFDLSDPTNPRLRGELVIPGFSTYMHQLDDTHLLTIGFDGSDQGDFSWFMGLALQIFDVGDLKNPRLIHKESIGTRGSSSDATRDHLAFTFFRDRGLLAVPIALCEGGNDNGGYGTTMTFNGLMIYRVSVEHGFERVAAIDHPGTDDCSQWWETPDSAVKRSVFMDDYVYSVSSTELVGTDLRASSHPVSQLALSGLPATLICY